MTPGSAPLFDPPPGSDDPLGMLVACHRRLERQLAALGRVVAVYQTREVAAYPAAGEAVERIIRHFHGPGRLHTEDEDASLFPRLAERDPACEATIAELEAGHQALESDWATLAPRLGVLAVTPEAADDALAQLADMVASFVGNYRAHMQREERDLFPRATPLLGPDALAAIGCEMAERRRGL